MTAKRTVLWIGGLVLLVAAVLVLDGVRLWSASRDPVWEVEQLIATTGLGPAAVVGEIGAGGGEMAREMARRLPQGRVYANELGEGSVTDLRAALAGVPNVEVVPGAVAATNLPDACCDLVYMRNVYHHFENADAINRDIRRALKPGGRYAVIDFEPGFGLLTFIPAARGVGHGVTPDEVAAEAGPAGFEVAQIDREWTGRTFLVVLR